MVGHHIVAQLSHNNAYVTTRILLYNIPVLWGHLIQSHPFLLIVVHSEEDQTFLLQVCTILNVWLSYLMNNKIYVSCFEPNFCRNCTVYCHCEPKLPTRVMPSIYNINSNYWFLILSGCFSFSNPSPCITTDSVQNQQFLSCWSDTCQSAHHQIKAILPW